MKKYLRTLKYFWTTAIAAQLEYQINFIVELIAMLGTLCGSIFILYIFFSDGRQIGYWTWESALVVQGVYTLLDGITNTFLRPNLNEIVNHVREGNLDFILLKPIDSQFWLSFRTLSPAGFAEILLGFFLVLSAAYRSGAIFTPIAFFCFLLVLISAIIILYSLWFIIASTSIWFVKTWNATEVLRSVLAAGRFPVIAYPITLRVVFTLVLPIAFLTTVPARVILGNFNLFTLISSIFVASVFFLLSRIFWNFALRFYTSASS